MNRFSVITIAIAFVLSSGTIAGQKEAKAAEAVAKADAERGK